MSDKEIAPWITEAEQANKELYYLWIVKKGDLDKAKEMGRNPVAYPYDLKLRNITDLKKKWEELADTNKYDKIFHLTYAMGIKLIADPKLLEIIKEK